LDIRSVSTVCLQDELQYIKIKVSIGYSSLFNVYSADLAKM
jgi:hypothetical protein